MTDFNRHPDSYHHWQLEYDGAVAHLRMNVNPEHPFRDGYELKLNSYDLAVDIELADAIQRLRPAGVDHQAGALMRKAQGGRTADPCAGTCDNGSLVRQK